MRGVRPADPPTELPPEWLQVLETLPPRARLLVLGTTDVGKSTFCWWAARELQARGGAAIVDADVGQSRVGPAACVGWTALGSRQLAFYFVGATSPQPRPLSALRATVRATRAAAASGVAYTIVDTTGYLAGETAVALKSSKISHLRPVHVVLMGAHPSFEAILAPWREDPEVVVHRVPRAAAARHKTTDSRSHWRRQCFAEWLAGSNLRWIESAGRRLLHMPPPELYATSPTAARELKGLLLGFGDPEGRGLCLGLLYAMDWQAQRILALCQPAAQHAAVVDFGSIRLAPDGRQL